MKKLGLLFLTLTLFACSSESEPSVSPESESAKFSQGVIETAPPKSEPLTIKVAPESTSFSIDDSYKIISEAEHDCSKVTSVTPKGDSTIATCDNGEKYRVVRITEPQVQDVAMKCSAMVKLGIADAC